MQGYTVRICDWHTPGEGTKKHGVRTGNWLATEGGKALLQTFDRTTLRAKCDYAMVAVLLGCGLRRAELADVVVHDLQQRARTLGVRGSDRQGWQIPTVPIPNWGAQAVHVWLLSRKF